jgi:hypothetical protein
MPHRSSTGVVVGTLNVLTGALMMWGGAQEVQAYVGAETWAVSIGALGFMAGMAFSASGIAMLLAHPLARHLVTIGGVGSAIVHAVGVMTGLVGMSGLLLGVVYPLAAMIVARRRPPAAATPLDDATRERPRGSRPRDRGTPRVAIAS